MSDSKLRPKRRPVLHKREQAIRLQSQTNGMRIAAQPFGLRLHFSEALVAGHERDVHTIAVGDGWINKIGGIQVDGLHRTQEAAIEAGRILATKNQSEHAIHGKDGKIREQNSYGYDPRDIRA